MNSPGYLLRLAEIVRDLQRKLPIDGHAALDDLVRSAAESVPGAQYASITISHRDCLETPSATSRHPKVLDEIQNRQAEGPCLSVAWEHHTIRIDDLESDTRWPRYRREALSRTPIRSVLSFRLFANKQKAGAFNLYAEQPRAFDDESFEVGISFATHLALAWGILQRDKELRSALASRDVIGQAKGIVIERFGIDDIAAFELLKQISQESNTPLAEIAQSLVRTAYPPR